MGCGKAYWQGLIRLNELLSNDGLDVLDEVES